MRIDSLKLFDMVTLKFEFLEDPSDISHFF